MAEKPSSTATCIQMGVPESWSTIFSPNCPRCQAGHSGAICCITSGNMRSGSHKPDSKAIGM